jgi:hypothetical protein
MNIQELKRYGKPGDIVLTGDNSLLSKLICFAQLIQTKDGKASRWSHCMILVNLTDVPEAEKPSRWRVLAWKLLERVKDVIKATGKVAESTMDLKPYGDQKKRLDNGPQYNYLENHTDVPRAMLLSFPWTGPHREEILKKAAEIINKGETYSILGLFGSLLSFWIFRWWKSNPLCTKHDLYCSAFVQECYSVDCIGIDFDPLHTARNTSPEMISQYDMPGLKKINLSERS